MKYFFAFFFAIVMGNGPVYSQSADSVVVLEINFPLDSYNLSEAQKDRVDSLLTEIPIAVLKEVDIYGHTDSLAGVEYNRILSKRRVQSILTYLVFQGLDPIIATADYYGEERPKYNNSPETRFRNRRVELHLTIDPSLLPPPEFRLTDAVFKKGEKIRIPNLNFVGNQPIPMPESFSVFEELLAVMQKYPDLSIQLQGHVCCNDNYELSNERAKMVHDFLAGNGIDPKRLSYKGFSNKKPLFNERTEKEEALNRRVEVLVIDNSDKVDQIPETSPKIDLRAPVMAIKFFPKKRRLFPSGHFMLTLIAEMMKTSAALKYKYEFVIFDNINDRTLTNGRVVSVKRAFLEMRVEQSVFSVRSGTANARMPVSENENFMMVKITEK